jgi:hypothetical protein
VLARVIGFVLVGALFAAAAAMSSVSDPARIVPWNKIGDIGFGMSHAVVEYRYGSPINGNPPRNTIIWKYQGVGVIQVLYDDTDRVEALATDSPEYTTASGIKVGMRIPLGKCYRVKGACQYRWHGFVWRDNLNFAGGRHHTFEWDWSGPSGSGTSRATVQLMIGSNGAVSEIWLARYLHCSWGDTTASTCKQPKSPPTPPPPAGLRYCRRPVTGGGFLAASPNVDCTTARRIETKVFSPACIGRTRCDAYGFTCLAVWDGRYDRPFTYTHHAACQTGKRRVEMDEG